MTPALALRLRRPDMTARQILEAHVETSADFKQRRDHWSAADSTAGLELLDDGGVRLADTTATKVESATSNGYWTDLNGPPALVDASPFFVAKIDWLGTEDPGLVIDRIVAWLHPQQDPAAAKTVAYWICQPFAVIGSLPIATAWPTGPDRGYELVPLAAPAPAAAPGASAAEVTFAWLGASSKPRPWSVLPEGRPIGFGIVTEVHPVTYVFIWAVQADGSPATNVGWGRDTTVAQAWSADFGTKLRGRKLTLVKGSVPSTSPWGGRPTYRWVYKDEAASPAATPRVRIETGTYAAAKIQFSGAGNRLALAAVPTGDVEFTGEGETPGTSSIVYEVLKDGGNAALDADWRAFTDGQRVGDLADVTKRQTYEIRARLLPPATGDSTPTLRKLGVREVAITDLSAVMTARAEWRVDPVQLQAGLTECRVAAVRDGERDYADAITELLAENDIGEMTLRLFWGDDALPRSQWFKVDEFLVDAVHPRASAVDLRCVSALALLRGKLPKYAGGISVAPASDTANPGAWTDEAAASTNLYSKVNEPTADDTTLVQSPLDPVNAALEVKFAALADPSLSSGHSVQFRYRKDASGGKTLDLTVELRQGGTVRATTSVTNVGDAWVVGSLNLSAAEADAITDYADLRVRFSANTTGGAGSRRVQVSWARFHIAGRRAPYVQANATVKAAFDDLVQNQAEIPARWRGPGVEMTTELVSKTIAEEPVDIKAEIDALCNVANGCLISSQGRLKFVDFHGAKTPVAVFDPNEIEVLEATPGYEERVPEFKVPWGWDPATKAYLGEANARHGPALTRLGPGRVDAADRLPDVIAKWLIAQAGDAPGESAQANRIAKRQVETLGTGYVRLRWRSAYAYPELEPGDGVVVPTDLFVARDPTAGRELRGQLWALAVLVETESGGREFGGWVRSYADLQGAAVLGDDDGMGAEAPELPQDELAAAGHTFRGGRLLLNWTGRSEVLSVKWATSTSSFPAAGTGTVVEGQNAASVDTGLDFVYANTVYVTLTPYTAAGGGGTQGAQLQFTCRLPLKETVVQASDGVLVRGTAMSDGLYALVSVTSDGAKFQDADGKLVVDRATRLIEAKDEQGTPQTRVQLGEIGAGASDWGLRIRDDAGRIVLDAQGSVLQLQESAASPTRGINVKGTRPAGWTRYLDLAATGSDPFLKHDKLSLNIDGTAEFSGLLNIIGAQGTQPGFGFYLLCRDVDVAHGITSQVDTDVVGGLAVLSATFGGLMLHGYTEAANTIRLFGVSTTPNTGPTNAGVVSVGANKKSGTSFTTLADAENAFSVDSNNNQLFRVTGAGRLNTKLGQIPVILGTLAGLSTTSAGVEVELSTISIPANTLATNGDAVRIVALVRHSGSVTGAFYIRFGSTTYVFSTTAIPATNGRCRVEVYVVRTGSNAQRSWSLGHYWTGTDGTTATPTMLALSDAPAVTDTSAILISFRGYRGGVSGSLFLDQAHVEYLKA
jgi:hypothetical protein